MILLLACLLIAAVFLPSLFTKRSISNALAQALGTNEKALSLNLPPSSQRLPGTIIAPYKDRVLTYGGPFRDDERIITGMAFESSGFVDSSLELVGSLSSSVLREALNNREKVEIEINIRDGRVLEMNVPELKEIIADLEYAADKRDLREKQFIIHKAYEGVVEYVVSSKDGKSAGFFADLDAQAQATAKSLAEIEYSIGNNRDESFSLSVVEPVVLAYECLSVEDVAVNLSGSGSDTEIELQEVSSRQMFDVGKVNAPKVAPKSPAQKRIGLITIASGHFDYLSSMDIPEVVSSAKKVHATLEKYGPVYENRLYSSSANTLTDTGILEWSIDLTIELIEQELDFLIVYYAGHGLQRGDAELLLPQGNLKKNFAEAALNSVEHPELDDGYLTAETLYDALGTTGTPYALIIDACFPSSEIQESLNNVYMTQVAPTSGELLYYGPHDLITNEMVSLSKTLRDIGNRFQYRTSDDVVVFSAKPGVLAPLVRDPDDLISDRMAPLASKLISSYESSFPQNDRSLADLIQSIIYTRGSLGEITLSGSISWSDQSELNAILGDVYVTD